MEKIKINKIVLDLDDTLASFTMTVLGALGCDVGPFDYARFPTQCQYDIIKAWKWLMDLDINHPITIPQFWSMVSHETWRSLPKSDEFWLLEAAAYMVGPENVLIATVPTKSAAAHSAKFEWIEEHCPDWVKRQYSITPRKNWLAQPGVLLIDDSDKNCDKFEEAGGHAILVPRPWNTLHEQSLNCTTSLREALNDYEGEV